MSALPPGSCIGILGGGQLGRMLSVAAARLGYNVHIFCPDEACPAAEVSANITYAHYNDHSALEAFSKAVDVVTLEFENIPLSTVKTVAEYSPVYPAASVLEICQHRVKEKDFIRSLDIATAPFARVKSEKELEKAIELLGFPFILKTTELGYDGKGQVKVATADEAHAAWEQLDRKETIAEGFIDFSMEISVIVARCATRQMAVYEPVQNIHRNHILHQTLAPAVLPSEVVRQARAIAEKIAYALELVGILAVEMFVCENGKLLVNELAPRPHNSGHWTLDASITDQFEQTIRAVCGLPLGSTKPLCNAVMTNLIGDEVNAAQSYLDNPRMKLHLYGKAEAKAGRKMGHVTELLP